MVKKTKEHIKDKFFSFDMFCSDVKELANMLKDKHYTNIYAIPRGGYILGLYLAHYLRLPITNKIGSNTLIVDDICDKGNTLEYYKENDKVVWVVKDTGLQRVPDVLYMRRIRDDVWAKFFWEVEFDGR